METNCLTDNPRKIGAIPGNVEKFVTSPLAESLPCFRLRSVVVPFDFSNAATILLTRVVRLAEHAGATVHILHVIEPRRIPASGEASSVQIYPGARAAAARMQIEQWVAQTFADQVAITTTVRVGRVADEVMTHARALFADLIVMSAHEGPAPRNILSGSTTERVVRLAACPVLVVPRGQVENFPDDARQFPLERWKRILLPTDISSHARVALDCAAAIIQKNRARLHILHCASEVNIDVQKRLSAWIAENAFGVRPYKVSLWSNLPLLNAILKEVKQSDIDLIILSPTQKAWFRRHRLGSTTSGILRHAPCMVLSPGLVSCPPQKRTDSTLN